MSDDSGYSGVGDMFTEKKPDGLLCIYSGIDIGVLCITDASPGDVRKIKKDMHVIYPWTPEVALSFSKGIIKYFRTDNSGFFNGNPPLRCFYLLSIQGE